MKNKLKEMDKNKFQGYSIYLFLINFVIYQSEINS